MPRDYTNQQFGRLTAHWPAGKTPFLTIVWLCTCACGALKLVSSHNLGRTVLSCGCLQRDKARASRGIPRKHGHATGRITREYHSWSSMLNRCKDATDLRYGGRGIIVCERWKKFKNFLADMGARPLGKTLDRINNDGNYEPGNCRWATIQEQNLNQRRNAGKAKAFTNS